MDVCLLWVLCVLSGRGLCDELITRPEESYRPRCAVVCDLETSWMRRPWPTRGAVAPKTNKYTGWYKIMLALVLNMTVVVRPLFHPRLLWSLFYLLLWGNKYNDIHWMLEYWIILSYMSNGGLRPNIIKSVWVLLYILRFLKWRRVRTECKLVRIEILKFCQKIVFESQKWQTESGIKSMRFVVSQSTAAITGFPGTLRVCCTITMSCWETR